MTASFAEATPDTSPKGAELVSVVMSNYCGARWLPAAMQSVLSQTHQAVELVIVDDASTDDSVKVIRAAMAGDARIRLIESPQNLGPSGARNLALAAARGSWVAVMDSDDLIHPARIERMLAAALHLRCDAVADDMIFFGETEDVSGRTLMQSLALTSARPLSLGDLLHSDHAGSGLPPYGYLKPLIRRGALDGLTYDPTLRVGEDFDFYARLLLRGARVMLLPDTLYLYRRHSASLSHRLSTDVLAPLIAAHGALESAAPRGDAAIGLALRQRRDALTWALHYAQLVGAFKQRDVAALVGLLARRPHLVKPLWQSLRERRMRSTASHRAPERTALNVVLVSAGDPVPAAVSAELNAAAQRIDVPQVGMPGAPAAVAPAPLAARLSALAARHHLSVMAVGDEGRHAAGMLPPGARVRFWPPAHSPAG